MNYDKKWKILADLITELKEQKKIVPVEIMNDLRSAKTIIQILKADPTSVETISRIEKYLRNIESYVISTGEELDKTIAENWLKKLKDKKMEKTEKINEKTTFILGIPRNEKWVRIKISTVVLPENLKKIAKANNLAYKKQKNDHIIVHGNAKNIKKMIKTITKQVTRAKKK